MPREDDLLRLLQEDPQKGFARLIREGGGFRFIDRLAADAGIKDPAFIEDLKSETLLALHRNVINGRLTHLSGKVSTYLYAIAKNILNTELRKRNNETKRIERFFTVDDTELELPDLKEDELDDYERQVKNCLDKLSEECRKLLQQRYHQDKVDYKYLQEVFGFASPAVAKQRVYACQEQIRKCVNRISSNMERDEAATLELLRRFLDGDLSPEEQAGASDLLRDDPRAAALLEEEIRLRAALSRISRQQLWEQARHAVRMAEQEDIPARSFHLSPGRWWMAAAALLALAIGAWWFFLRPRPGEIPFASPAQRNILLDQRLPVWREQGQTILAPDSLRVVIREGNVKVSRYTLTVQELVLESPAGTWTPPFDIRLYRDASSDSLLLQINTQTFWLQPREQQHPLPPPGSLN